MATATMLRKRDTCFSCVLGEVQTGLSRDFLIYLLSFRVQLCVIMTITEFVLFPKPVRSSWQGDRRSQFNSWIDSKN